MSGLDLGALGLTEVDGDHNPVATVPEAPAPPAPAAPAAPEPVVPAAPAVPSPVQAPPAVEEPIVVPPGAENPDAVRNAIQAERRRAREAYAHAKEMERRLLAIEEANMPVEDRLRAADARAAQAEGALLRLKVGLRHSLPETLVDRLRGSTEEELEGDAQSLLSQLNLAPGAPSAPEPAPAPAPAVPVPTASGYQMPPAAPQPDPNVAHGQFLAALFRGGSQQ